MILNKISSFVATSSGRTSTKIKAALSTSSSFVIQGQRSHITTTSYSEKNDNENDIIPSTHSIQPQPITQFTEEERMVQQSIRTFAQNDILPLVRQMENDQQIHPQIISSLFENGLMGLEIPECYNGSNMNFTSACIAIEEISKIDPSVALLVDVQNTLIVNSLRFWGSDELQDEILPKLALETVGGFCLSEANAGTDAFAMGTKAVQSYDGSYYALHGSKMWISHAREAGLFIVFANVDPSKGYKGITAFVVDSDTDGIFIGPSESKLGLKACSTCPVTFDHVKVDASRVLGEVGSGYKYCIEILNEGRIGIAAQQIGIAKGCMDIVLPYLFERKQFGQAIGDFQGVQHQYAQLSTEIHAAETMLYNACRLKENNLPFVKEASMVKLFSSQVAEKVTSKSIELLGGIGFTTETLVEKFYRDCKVGSIYEGTSNIQLQTISKILKSEYS